MPKKHLGQNFLYDPSILEKIVQASRLGPEDFVVEIGSGPGMLTGMLAARAAKVLAIELDADLLEKSKRKLSGYDNVELIYADALGYPYRDLPGFKVVANIPYYITTPIIFKLLDAKKNLISMTLTIQKEVAERIVAEPGGKDYGVLSIMVQYYAKPDLIFVIPKESFRPVPKVDSAVIHIEILNMPAVDVEDEEIFVSVVKTAFSQRRKMLSNSLKSLRGDVKEWLGRAGIAPNRRPETLSIKEFAKLSNTP
jgi:16S rRNA (adenine1518-N6/adenine1519-N6)-dimethyltransferase